MTLDTILAELERGRERGLERGRERGHQASIRKAAGAARCGTDGEAKGDVMETPNLDEVLTQFACEPMNGDWAARLDLARSELAALRAEMERLRKFEELAREAADLIDPSGLSPEMDHEPYKEWLARFDALEEATDG